MSELQRFASLFTQDGSARSASFLELAGHNIQGLSPERKAVLSREYRTFLCFYTRAAPTPMRPYCSFGLLKELETWDADLRGRPVMEDCYHLMNPTAWEFAELAVDPGVDEDAVSRGFVDIGLKPRQQQD